MKIKQEDVINVFKQMIQPNENIKQYLVNNKTKFNKYQSKLKLKLF
jgi:hypothetical protein